VAFTAAAGSGALSLRFSAGDDKIWLPGPRFCFKREA
jgi:hypothetical protein